MSKVIKNKKYIETQKILFRTILENIKKNFIIYNNIYCYTNDIIYESESPYNSDCDVNSKQNSIDNFI